jgi:predicted amidophosphoribosyltransferase
VATLKFDAPSIMISMLKSADPSKRHPWYLDVLGRIAAGYMLANLDDMRDYSLILPSPTHPDTVAERGFDITAHIHKTCEAIAGPALPGVEFDDLNPPVWEQTKRVGARKKNWKERREAVKGAYRVKKEHREYIEGRRVLILDDVYTTGLDMDEMAAQLLDAGAARVDGLAVTRQIKTSAASEPNRTDDA